MSREAMISQGVKDGELTEEECESLTYGEIKDLIWSRWRAKYAHLPNEERPYLARDYAA